MKTVLRVFSLGLFAAIFAGSAASATYAQDVCSDIDANQALYKKFTDNYQSNEIPEIRIAIKAAEDYVQKYGSCTDYEAQVNYLKAAPASLKERIKQIEEAAKKAEQQKRYRAFNAALKSDNTNDLYRVGPEILANEPDLVDVVLVLGFAGLDSALKEVDTHNNATVKYAKMGIQMLNSGAASKQYGILQYAFKSKDNAIGWMNFSIGMITFHRKGNKDQALPYLYNAASLNSDTKKNPVLFGTFGDFYLEKVIKLGEQRGALDAKEEANFAEIDRLLGLEKAYAERGADAYARAFSLATADKSSTADYKKILFDNLKKLYTFRFEKDDETTTTATNTDADINTYVAAVVTKPLPNPTSAVTPIVEKKPEPAETKTTDTTTTGATRNRSVSKKKTGN